MNSGLLSARRYFRVFLVDRRTSSAWVSSLEVLERPWVVIPI